jgi:hypothetical protein
MKVKFQNTNTKFQIANFKNSTLSALRSILFISIILAADCGQRTADVFADVYAPSDTIVLTVGCLDSTFLNVANPDSVWFKWWRDVGGPTLVDSAKVTTGVRTGFFRKKIKASDGSNNLGTYIASAMVYKGGRSGIKTWNWTVKAEFDSITNAIKDVNKGNFKADVSGLLAKNDTAGAVNYLRTKTVEPEVKVVSTDSLAYVSQIGSITAVDSVRKVYLVDSLQQEVVALTDTTKIKIMNNNNQWGASYTWNYSTRTLTSGAGSGANSVVIRCKQSSDSTNIAGTQIQILDSVQNATIGLLTSDSQARGFFALDNGTYSVRLYKPGWQFTVPETLNVDGNEDTTYYANAFDAGSPPQANLCRVYGWLYDINNLPVAGAKIQASINVIPLRYENIVISPYYKSAATDDQGFWYLDLYPNSALNPADTKYIFFIYSPSGTILRIETPVPNQGSWELQW